MEVAQQQILVRQALYRFYAGLLQYPESERMLTLTEGAGWLHEALAEYGDDEVWRAARGIVELVKGQGNELEPLQTEWVRLFGASRDGYCHPYEGAYALPQTAAPLLAELQREYARAGLELATNDLPDHISVELEYMSYLCGLELQTLGAGEDDRRRRIVRAQYMFLQHHLGAWLPALAEQVAAATGEPYATVCGAAELFAKGDAAALAGRVEDAPAPH